MGSLTATISAEASTSPGGPSPFAATPRAGRAAPSVTSVSTGDSHSCALHSNGAITCWGSNDFGESIPPTGNFVEVSAGFDHTCAIRAAGTAVCWGDDTDGQSTPAAGVLHGISAGHGHTCAIQTDDTAVCWGDDTDGESTPPAVTFSVVSAGGSHTCGVRINALMECWGSNSQLQADTPIGNFTSVSSGEQHTCGIYTDQTLLCWGANNFTQSSPPLGTYDRIVAGRAHTCARATDLSLSCWGNGFYGQTTAPGGSHQSVDAGGDHSCGVATGEVSCWGFDEVGQRTAPASTFTEISAGFDHTCGIKRPATVVCFGQDVSDESSPPPGTFTQVSTGQGHSCGLRTDRSVACWGWDSFGEASPPSGTFTQLDAGENHTCGVRANVGQTVTCWGNDISNESSPPAGAFTQVSAGTGHSCGVKTDTTIACWGRNDFGQRTVPPGTYLSVSAGEYFTCALRTNFQVTCWGDPTDGKTTPPAGWYDAVSAGSGYACGIHQNDTLECWGTNSVGQTAAPAGTYTGITTGFAHACAISTAGAYECWGLYGVHGPPVGAPSAEPSEQLVILGDSWASGEGAPDPVSLFVTPAGDTDLEGWAPEGVTRIQGDLCHRSVSASTVRFADWSGWDIDNPAAVTGARSVACSGATLDQLTAAWTDRDHDEAAQIDALDGAQDRVLVQFGFDHVGIRQLIDWCVVALNCNAASAAGELPAGIDAFEADYTAALTAITAAAPGATVTVITYPRFLPTGPTGCTAASGLTQAERTFIDTMVQRLDDRIVDAATAAGVDIVDTRNAFAGHDACATVPWVWGLRTNEVPAWNSARNQEFSFHPNVAGHDAMAAALVAPPAPTTSPGGALPPATTFAAIRPVGGMIEWAVTEPSWRISFTVDGFQPSSPVSLGITPVPTGAVPTPPTTSLGVATVGVTGAIAPTVTVPNTVAAGPAIIVAQGADPAGAIRIATLLVLLPDGSCDAIAGFLDVPLTSPFCTPIDWLAGSGITGGYPDGTFKPAASISRQAMAAFLYRLSGEPAFTPPAVPTFPDVPTSSAFFLPIEWAFSTGLAGGYADGGFHPADPISRQAMAAFLHRLAGSPVGPFPDPGFFDVPAIGPFSLAIAWLADTGVTGGYPDGGYHPTAAVTRQAMAAFLYRLVTDAPA